ncbi:hypothetical protein BH20ACT9_BH20ACT9_19620 [soil metagenome]
MLTRARARLQGADGITIVELLVVMVVFGVVGSLVASGVIQGLQSSRLAQARVEALADVQKGVGRMSRELRAACPVRTATATQVVVDVRRAGGVDRYGYTLDDAADELRYEVYEPATALVPTSDGVLMREVVNTAPFTAYDSDGNVTTDPKRVTRLGILVERDLPEQDAITVQTDVSARNGTRCPS